MHAVPFAPVITKPIDTGLPGVIVIRIVEILAEIATVWVIADAVSNAAAALMWIFWAQATDSKIYVYAWVGAEIWSRGMR